MFVSWDRLLYYAISMQYRSCKLLHWFTLYMEAATIFSILRINSSVSIIDILKIFSNWLVSHWAPRQQNNSVHMGSKSLGLIRQHLHPTEWTAYLQMPFWMAWLQEDHKHWKSGLMSFLTTVHIEPHMLFYGLLLIFYSFAVLLKKTMEPKFIQEIRIKWLFLRAMKIWGEL